MNVILIGYRGSGKSTVGRLLADMLQGTFADVDDHIMARFEGRSVAEIWRQFGEPAYRQVEVKVTAELCQSDIAVIGLGGGTLMQPEARHVVEQLKDALRIYLYASAQVLYQRISSDPTSSANRPSLTTHGGGLREIEIVLLERDPVYRAVADHVIEVNQQPPQQIAEQIMRLVNVRCK